VALVYVVFVVSMYMFIGLSGVLSFGHMAFASIGAYAGAIMVMTPEAKSVALPELYESLNRIHLDTVPATIIAGLVACAVALVVGSVIMRLSAIAISLASFAVLAIVNVVALQWRAATNGTHGMADVPATTTLLGALIWAIIVIVVAYALKQSRWGVRLQATREDEIVARASGAGVVSLRLIAWTVSAFFMGVGGALLAQFLRAFTPGVFYFEATFLALAMLIVGGRLSVSGAVIGTAVISIAAEFFLRLQDGFAISSFEVAARPGLQPAALAIIMLVALIKRPEGLMGTRELGDRLALRWSRPRQQADEGASESEGAVTRGGEE
jgi:branched-chain amino acid transport system permease protein